MTAAERTRRWRELKKAGRPKKELLPLRPELLPGALTAQLVKDSFVRRLIDANFPQLGAIARACNRKLHDQGLRPLPRVHKLGVVGRLAGTAIDYRLRCYFGRRVHSTELIKLGRFLFGKLSKKGDKLDKLLEII